MNPYSHSALILVDIQRDFCQGGSLAVPEGESIVPLANQLQAYFPIVIASADWHPLDHASFAQNQVGKSPGELIDLDGVQQVLWPSHCVQGEEGSRFHPDLHTENITKIIYKGTNPRVDSYSAFFDNARKQSTGLEAYLKEKKVKSLYIMGLATDYCVKYTCLDAVSLGFQVYLIVDACRGIDLHPGDIEKALDEMRQASVILLHSVDLSENSSNSKA